MLIPYPKRRVPPKKQPDIIDALKTFAPMAEDDAAPNGNKTVPDFLSSFRDIFARQALRPSDVPIPFLNLSLRTMENQARLDAAGKIAPGPLEIEQARALAQREAAAALGLPETFEPVPMPILPNAPKPPDRIEPPTVGPLARPGVADFVGAIFGLLKPQYAASFTNATLQGRVQAQADDFNRKRQFWQDMMTAEQNAYENNLQQYNLETAKAITAHNVAVRNRDVKAANAELLRAARLTLAEREAIAKHLAGLATKEADARTAAQRAEAFKAAADAADAPYEQEREFAQKVMPSIINAMGSLAATMANLPAKKQAADTRAAELALRQQMQPFRIQDIQSRIQDRLFRQGIAGSTLELATKHFGLAVERFGWDKQKFAAWIKSTRIPPEAQSILEIMRAKTDEIGRLKMQEIMAPLVGALDEEGQSRLGTAIRNLNIEVEELGERYADVYKKDQESRAGAAGLVLPPELLKKYGPGKKLPTQPAQGAAIYRGMLNGSPITIRPTRKR